MKNLKDIVLEKLKISVNNASTTDLYELFNKVLRTLWDFGELDVKPLQLMCSYMHDNSHKIRSIDHIYYSNAPKSKKEWMMATLDNDVSVRIDDFNMFHSLVFSKNDEPAEEILNKILHLMSN